MPDKRKHRGPHPRDAELFSVGRLPVLRTAVSELSWLLSRGYAADAALKVVGDRHQLVKRQRVAVRRAAASDEAVERRLARRISLDSVSDTLLIDGFNLIVTVEAAFARGVLLKCRDGAIRDLASMHGSYRKVEETIDAIRSIGAVLDTVSGLPVRWLLDSPVSNSGRLAAILRDIASENGYRWEVELAPDVDRRLIESGDPVVTSDSIVLDATGRWVNLAERVIDPSPSATWIVDLQSA